MKKIYSLLTALVLCASTFAATYTFYYGVPNSQTYTPYIWVTNAKWTVLTNPAHQAMTYLGMNGDVKIYKFELETDETPGYIIFTPEDGWNGQSGNVTATDHGYYFGGNNNNCSGASTTADATYASDNAALGLAPSVVLSPSSDLVMEGETISLSVTPQHFSGTPSYTYSYSTDGGASYTSMGTDHTLVAGAPGTVYKFKVEASYNTENASSEATVKVVVCSVVGTTNLTGYNWDTSKNDMDYDAVSGVFTWTKKHVSLPESNGTTTAAARFKIVVCHEWGIEFPSKDYGLTIGDADYYDVVITFNWADREETGNGISVTATKTPLVSLAADKAYALAGNTVALTATPTNFTGDILYTYSYKVGEAEYVKIAENVASATYNWILPADVASGTYSIKVDAACAAQNQNATSTNTVEVKVANSWTVAGVAALLGVNWDLNATANDMSISATDGVLTLVKNHTYVSAGNHEYKVFRDRINDDSHPQFPAYGSQGQKYNFVNAGYYDLTFTFDWANWNLTLVATPLGPKVELVGDFTGWTESVEMVDDNGLLVANINNMPAGIQEFKLRINDVLKSDLSAGTMVRGASSNWNIDFEANNTKLKADVAGKYTFTFNPDGYLLSVSFPESFTRPASANYGSLCVPFDAELENAYAYQITSQDANTVTITKLNTTNLVAGHSYIIKAIDANEDITISKVSEGNVASSPVDDENHFGVLGASLTLTDANADAYVLTNNQLCPIGDGGSVTVVSTKAYFKLPAAASAPSYRIVEAENNTTGVENIEANGEAVKFFENGQLFILRDGVVYDATGRAVK